MPYVKSRPVLPPSSPTSLPSHPSQPLLAPALILFDVYVRPRSNRVAGTSASSNARIDRTDDSVRAKHIFSKEDRTAHFVRLTFHRDTVTFITICPLRSARFRPQSFSLQSIHAERANPFRIDKCCLRELRKTRHG